MPVSPGGLDLSIVVFDCIAANPKHMFASLKESGRAHAGTCARAGLGAALPVLRAFAHNGVFFLPLQASAQVTDSIPR